MACGPVLVLQARGPRPQSGLPQEVVQSQLSPQGAIDRLRSLGDCFLVVEPEKGLSEGIFLAKGHLFLIISLKDAFC